MKKIIVNILHLLYFIYNHYKKNNIIPHVPNFYGDRFIPRRYNNNDKNIKEPFYKKEEKQIDILKMKDVDGYWRLHLFRKSFESCFGILDSQTILYFHDWITSDICFETLNKQPTFQVLYQKYNNFQNLDWPCFPRLRPSAFIDSTHDLPGFKTFSHLKIIAWSKSGKVACSFGKDLVLWVPRNESTVVYKIDGIKTLSFNNDGSLLAVGKKCPLSVYGTLQIWNVVSDGIFVINYFQYSKSINEYVRCIDWDHINRYLLCGMSSGNIYVHKVSTLDPIKCILAHNNPLNEVKFSARSNYFASADICGHVIVWQFSTLKTCIEWEDTSVCLIDWHPWRETDFVIGTTVPATISLVSLVSNQVEAYYQRFDENCELDALTFNRISGELVVSFMVPDLTSEVGFLVDILVLASMNRIVDTLISHENRVRFLMWNPDGTQLASAGDDETLHIWHFFSNPKIIKKKHQIKSKKSNKFSLTNSFLNSR